MTPATLPPLGLLTPPPVCVQQPLALFAEVVCDEPTARERLDLLRQLRRVGIGDAWVSGEYRVERYEDSAEHIRLARGAHVCQRFEVDTAGRLRAALDSFADVLLGAGITDGWLRVGALCGDVLEQESDEPAGERAYNRAECEAYAQEALVVVPMQISVYGFDDDPVTLRDGTISVVQEGYPFRVSGSRSFVRDPRLSRLNPAQVSRAIRRAAWVGLPLLSPPAHLKWCSDHPTPKHIDPRLLATNPVAYWEQKGFVPRAQFGNSPVLVNGKPKYRDGKKPVCNECRARHERMLYAARKAERGEAVRAYRNHGRPTRPTSSTAA